MTDTVSKAGVRAIMEALERRMKNKTPIVIAHRRGTILHADTIFAMKDHRFVERGSHDELRAAGGFHSGL